MTVTKLTERQLNRSTLARQMLLHREHVGVLDSVRRIAAVQAQEPASPYIALWNRVAGFDPADLDAAFAERAVVKSNLLRLTLHAVDAGDWPTFHVAMRGSLRQSRLGDRRYTTGGLTSADADDQLPYLAKFLATPRSGAEVEDFLETRLGTRNPWAWWALKRYAPVHHVPTGGPWSFALPYSYIAAATGAESGPASDTEDAAIPRLLLRYLEAFGPASAADFSQFTMLRQPVVKAALKALDGEIATLEGPNGALFDIPDAEVPAEDVAAPVRLLPMWDSTLLAYADRDRVIPPDFRSVVIRRNGDVLPTLLVDGYVAGVWRPLEGGHIEATAFHRLDAKTWKALDAEAGALTKFLADRQPLVYSRYNHWWAKGMPSVEVRTLGG